MKTFAEIRTYAIEQYSRIAEKQAEVDAAYEKMLGMNIYTSEYLTKIKKAGEAEVAAVRAVAAANLEAVVKLTLAEKKTALEKMLATAPSTEQTNLLNTLQVQGNRITPDEIKSIAVQLSGNYRALHTRPSWTMVQPGNSPGQTMWNEPSPIPVPVNRVFSPTIKKSCLNPSGGGPDGKMGPM